MFCVKCGAQLDDNAIFCPKCGNKVGEVSATASASPEVIVKSKRDCIYDAVFYVPLRNILQVQPSATLKSMKKGKKAKYMSK